MFGPSYPKGTLLFGEVNESHLLTLSETYNSLAAQWAASITTMLQLPLSLSLFHHLPFPLFDLYPEWPHRQCVGLIFRRSHVRSSLSAVSLVICSPARIAVCNTLSSGGNAQCRVGGATSQLDLQSLTPLSVAGCG